MNNIENLPPLNEDTNLIDQEAFVKLLTTLGLREFEIELLIARYIDGSSYSKIAKDLWYTDKDAARYHHKTILEKLKRHGITYNYLQRKGKD